MLIILILMAGSSVGAAADLKVSEVLQLCFIGRDILHADLLFFLYSVFCLLDLVLLAGQTRCRPRRRRHAFRFSRRCAQTSV